MLTAYELITIFVKKKPYNNPIRLLNLAFLLLGINDLFRRDGNKTQQLATHCKELSLLEDIKTNKEMIATE